MHVDPATDCHLTYCSNIHPGESWPEVRATVDQHYPQVRAALGWDEAFGVGLRVSAEAASALIEPAVRDDLKDLLARHNLYVFTLNGFPYGPFHGTRVKEDVYLPDWRERERVDYTCALIDLMAAILPADQGLYGSISTVPGAFKARVNCASDVTEMVLNMVECVAYAVEVERKTGVRVVIALEPEPCCYLETVAESVEFFTSHLYGAEAFNALATRLGTNPSDAGQAIRRHLGLCLDLCHAAVEFESAADCLAALRASDVAIYKMQVSAGLRFLNVGAHTVAQLEPFNDDVYLHQVVARSPDGTVARFSDLPQAFESLPTCAAGTEWRVHFHVPIFLDSLGEFSSTQDFIREMLSEHRRSPVSQHIEVETYTWSVLPDELRSLPIHQAVARELDWTRSCMENPA
jgi:hypothetical protein